MINRIKALLAGGLPGDGQDTGHHGQDELQVAAAALLVEAARMDEAFDTDEWGVIRRLLATRFALNEAETLSLMETAETKVSNAVELYSFARVVKDSFDAEQRVELMEMLWTVVYADGTLHDHEASLMRRVAGLIYVSDRDSGAARKRARQKLNITDGAK